MLLTYQDIAQVFKQFRTEDELEQSAINLVCELASYEIDDYAWGQTAKAGLLYLIACKLSCGAIEEAKASMANSAAQLLKQQQASSQDTSKINNLENWHNLPISSIAINDEMTITFTKQEALGETAISEIMKTVTSPGTTSPESSNFYCQQYKELRSLVIGSPLYSGE
jgi:hypothetical protein